MPSLTPPGAGAFAEFLGVTVTRADDACFEVTMEASGDHVNAWRVVHGGLQMTLLDMAMGGAVARTLSSEESCASVNISTDFLRPGPVGPLVARGRIDRRGRGMAFPVGELVDSDGRLVARATGVWVIRPIRA